MINEAEAIEALRALIPVIGMYDYNETRKRPNRVINWQYLNQTEKIKAKRIMKKLNIAYYDRVRFGLSVEKSAVIRTWMFKAELATYWQSRGGKPKKKIWPGILKHDIDPNAPDTLGWKVFEWDGEANALVSPVRYTVWPNDGMLEDAPLTISQMVEGQQGIHASLMPIDWKQGPHPYTNNNINIEVLAIVERWGKAVVGERGWRAEKVIIKEVLAPNTKVGLAIEQAYPSIKVHYTKD